jgi:hypothetical protein
VKTLIGQSNKTKSFVERKGSDDRDEPHGAEAAPPRQEEMPHSSRAGGSRQQPLPGRTPRQNPATPISTEPQPHNHDREHGFDRFSQATEQGDGHRTENVHTDQIPALRSVADGKDKTSNSAGSIISQFRAGRRAVLDREEEPPPTQKKKRREESGGFFAMTARTLTPRNLSQQAFRLAKSVIFKWTPPSPPDPSVIALFDQDNPYNTFDVDWFSFNIRGGIDQSHSDDVSPVDFDCDNI